MAVEAQLYSEHMYLCGSHDMFMGIGEGVGFQEPPQQALNFIGCNPYSSGTNQEGSSLSSSSGGGASLSMDFSQSLAFEIEKQTLEMDWYLQLQNERLRAALHEETRQQAVMLRLYESRMVTLIHQKDEILATARIKAMELQDYLIRAEMEANAWKKKTIETEAIMVDLNNKLNQIKEFNMVQEAESICCSSNKGNIEEKQEMTKMACKMCHVQNSCVLFLPCRHLCCCKNCDSLVTFCPVCENVKNGSVEVFFG